MWWRGFLPRDVREARTIGQIALAIPTIAFVAISISQLFLAKEWVLVADLNSDQASIVNSVILPAVLIVLFCFVRWGPDRAVSCTMVFIGAGGSALAYISSVSSNDATAGGVVFYAVPVIFGAFILGLSGAVLLLSFSLLCVAVHFLVVESQYSALQDIAATGTALIVLCVLVSRARSQESALQQRLQWMAQTDFLTGFSNRQVLDEKLEGSFASEDGGFPLALLVIDIDFFKTVNDQHGHPVGDAALHHVAEVVRSVVDEGSVLARLGGDEFAVLLTHVSPCHAMGVARDVVKTVNSRPLRCLGSESVPLTVSVGVGVALSSEGSATELYARADSGLYVAKQAGRDQAAYAQAPKASQSPGVHQMGKLS